MPGIFKPYALASALISNYLSFTYRSELTMLVCTRLRNTLDVEVERSSFHLNDEDVSIGFEKAKVIFPEKNRWEERR